MHERPLGKTGITASEIALGGLYTSSLGKGVDESVRIVEEAIDGGVTLVDTAPGYGDSERTLGEVFRKLGSKSRRLMVSTKLGGRPQPFDPRDLKGLRFSVEESCRLLGRDTLDLLLIHEPDRPGIYDWWDDPQECRGPVLDLLRALKKEGTIRCFGLGGTTVTEMAHIVARGEFEVLLTAFNYNALYREAAAELLPLAIQRSMGVLIGSVFGQGGLGKRYDEVVKSRPRWLSRPRQRQLLAFYAFLDETGMSITEISLRFVLSNPGITCALVGARTAEQYRASLAIASKGPLPPDVLRKLDAIAAMVPFRPAEEPLILPFGKNYPGPGMANLGAGVPVGRL